MIKGIILIYCIHVVSVLIHELAHFLAANILMGGYEEFCIGNIIKIAITPKLIVSPIILTGYVGVDKNKLLGLSGNKIVLFFLIGPFVNLFISMVLWGSYSHILFFVISRLNLLYFICSIVPIGTTDVGTMLRILKNKQRCNLQGRN